MRIGLVTQCYLPTQNGVVASVETFRRGLTDAGHEVFIFAPTFPGWPRTSRSRRSGRIFHVASLANPVSVDYPLVWPYYPISSHLNKIIKALKLDLLHGQHQFGLPVMVRKIARHLLIPYLCTYHTDLEQYTHYVPLFGRASNKAVLNKATAFLNGCDGVITPSGPMAWKLRRYGVVNKINIVKTGIEVKDYQKPLANFKKRLNIPENFKVLLYSGRLAREKNLEFLIKAFQLIKNEYSNCHLVLAGGGPEEQYFRELINNQNLGSDVSFTGFLPRRQVNQIYASVDIFIFASLTDTQGIVLTEAMAGGIPVVAIDKMGPSEIVKSGLVGYLTNNSLADFKAKVLKLLRDDELRTKMGAAAQKYAQQFSIKNTTTQLINIYQSTQKQFQLDHLAQTRYNTLVNNLMEK